MSRDQPEILHVPARRLQAHWILRPQRQLQEEGQREYWVDPLIHWSNDFHAAEEKGAKETKKLNNLSFFFKLMCSQENNEMLFFIFFPIIVHFLKFSLFPWE